MKDTKTYNYAIWRRKTSSAIIKLYTWWKWIVNVIKKEQTISLNDYFWWVNYLIENALYPFYIIWENYLKSFDIEIIVKWWGIRWQSDAIRLGLTRSLVEFNSEFRLSLKPHWLLKRDSRKKERMKPWLKKARKSPQWSKR